MSETERGAITMKQKTLATRGFDKYTTITRRAVFLGEVDETEFTNPINLLSIPINNFLLTCSDIPKFIG
jgi:hypothetical protein